MVAVALQNPGFIGCPQLDPAEPLRRFRGLAGITSGAASLAGGDGCRRPPSRAARVGLEEFDRTLELSPALRARRRAGARLRGTSFASSRSGAAERCRTAPPRDALYVLQFSPSAWQRLSRSAESGSRPLRNAESRSRFVFHRSASAPSTSPSVWPAERAGRTGVRDLLCGLPLNTCLATCDGQPLLRSGRARSFASAQTPPTYIACSRTT